MSLSNFRSYQLAKQLYRNCQTLKLPHYAKDQLLRASLSVATNLGEGSGRRTDKDRRHFYQMALGSVREVQVLLELHGNEELVKQADQTGAAIFSLVRTLSHS